MRWLVCCILIFCITFVKSARYRDRLCTNPKTAVAAIQNVPPKVPLGITEALNFFSLKLFDVLSRAKPKENLIYSPVGIANAFSMLMLGANKDSESEVFYGLGLNYSFRSPGDVHSSFKRIYQDISKKTEYDLDIVNIILTQKDFPILKTFIQRLGNFYRVGVGEVDFANQGREVMTYLNKWVFDRTHGKIDQILKAPLDPLTRLVVLNAVYFRGVWRLGFNKDETVHSHFFNSDGTTTEVPFMQGTGQYGFVQKKEKGFKMLELKYKGGASLFLLLPLGKKSLVEVMQSVTLDDLPLALDEQKVQIAIPKYKLRKEYNLKEVLPDLGIKAIFGEKADFSRINGKRSLFVSEGIHSVVFELDEEGTIAASATGVVVGNRNFNGIPTFTADKPFLFFIRNTGSGVIYFMGAVNTLKVEGM